MKKFAKVFSTTKQGEGFTQNEEYIIEYLSDNELSNLNVIEDNIALEDAVDAYKSCLTYLLWEGSTTPIQEEPTYTYEEVCQFRQTMGLDTLEVDEEPLMSSISELIGI